MKRYSADSKVPLIPMQCPKDFRSGINPKWHIVIVESASKYTHTQDSHDVLTKPNVPRTIVPDFKLQQQQQRLKTAMVNSK